MANGFRSPEDKRRAAQRRNDLLTAISEAMQPYSFKTLSAAYSGFPETMMRFQLNQPKQLNDPRQSPANEIPSSLAFDPTPTLNRYSHLGPQPMSQIPVATLPSAPPPVQRGPAILERRGPTMDYEMRVAPIPPQLHELMAPERTEVLPRAGGGQITYRTGPQAAQNLMAQYLEATRPSGFVGEMEGLNQRREEEAGRMKRAHMEASLARELENMRLQKRLPTDDVPAAVQTFGAQLASEVDPMAGRPIDGKGRKIGIPAYAIKTLTELQEAERAERYNKGFGLPALVSQREILRNAADYLRQAPDEARELVTQANRNNPAAQELLSRLKAIKEGEFLKDIKPTESTLRRLLLLRGDRPETITR